MVDGKEYLDRNVFLGAWIFGDRDEITRFWALFWGLNG